jgi:hypothetical protein
MQKNTRGSCGDIYQTGIDIYKTWTDIYKTGIEQLIEINIREDTEYKI